MSECASLSVTVCHCVSQQEALRRARAEQDGREEKSREQRAAEMECMFCLDLMCGAVSLACGHCACHWCLREFLQVAGGGVTRTGSSSDEGGSSSEESIARMCPKCREPIGVAFQPVPVLAMDALIREHVAKNETEADAACFARRYEEHRNLKAALAVQAQAEATERVSVTAVRAHRHGDPSAAAAQRQRELAQREEYHRIVAEHQGRRQLAVCERVCADPPILDLTCDD